MFFFVTPPKRNPMFSFHRFFSYIILLSAAVLSFSACVRKYDPDRLASGSWDPNLAVPLAFSHFTVYDILDRVDSNDLVVIDPSTGLLALVYTGQAFSFSARDVLELPDFAFSAQYSAGDFGFPTISSFSQNLSGNSAESFNYTPDGGGELYTLTLEAGELAIDVETDLQHDLDVQLTFPYITLNGSPLVVNLPLNNTGMPTSAANAQIDLSNYLVDFTAGGGTNNTLEYEVQATISGNGNPIDGNEDLTVEVALNGLLFSLVTGDFGQRVVGVDGDSILLAIFQNVTDGYFELNDPRLYLNVSNSFGFPVEIDITELRTVNTNDGTVYPMAGFPNPTEVGYPILQGDSVSTTLLFNSSNTSNITNVITPVPKYLHFAFQGISNPAGQAETPNFITSDSRLRIDARLELPLQGFAYGFMVVDTVEFTFDEALDEVEWVKIRLNATNGFPVDLHAQILLADADYNILETLLTDEQAVLVSGQTDVEGRVIVPTQKITDILIPRERIDLLYDAAYLIIRADANTLNGTSGEVVGIYEDNYIDLRLGMQVQGRIGF
jgi:hypothetical protein